MTVHKRGMRREEVTFTPIGDDRYRCDICAAQGREVVVRGTRGIGGHKGFHTGAGRERRRIARGGAASGARSARIVRETAETRVSVELVLDGTGQSQVDTGNGMLNHLVAQLARHGLLDLKVTARGDTDVDWHHLVEDVATVLGRALAQAVGEGKGIVRMGHAAVPLEEALAMVAVDLSGRGYAVVDTSLGPEWVGQMPGSLVAHFLERLAIAAEMTLHARVTSGRDPHHKAEALFKALALALRQAVQVEPRAAGQVPSTKGTLRG